MAKSGLEEITRNLSDTDISELKKFSIENEITFRKIIGIYSKWKIRLDDSNISYKLNDFFISFKNELFGTSSNWLGKEFVHCNYSFLCEEDKIKLHTYLKSLLDKRGSMYDPVNVSIKLSVSIEEANQIVEDRKNKTSGTLRNFINRHGEELGKKKFDEFKKKSKCSIENYKNRYGNSWEEKWKDYISTRDSSSLTYWIGKLGETDGQKKYDELKIQFAKSSNVYYYIEKYGSDGENIYNEICRKKGKTKEDMISKYGIEYATEVSMRKSIIFMELIKLYDYSDAKIKYEKYKLDKVSPIIYENKSANFLYNKRNCVSKKSISTFEKLEKIIGRTLMYGKKKDELKLFDHISSKIYYYDCFDIESNTIIEFNGSTYHAPENITHEEKMKWTNPWGVSWEYIHNRDKEKINFATNSGYNVIVIWDYEIVGKNRLHKKLLELKDKLNENKEYAKSIS